MPAVEILFWSSLVILVYTYAGYGIMLMIFNALGRLFTRKKILHQELLPLTLIVAAYNEEEVIRQKIANTLEINYPAHLLDIIFVTDGSTDDTMKIVSQQERIMHLHQPERLGKPAALKRAMRFVRTPVVVFSDANSMLNKDCLLKLVGHYADPQVGGVAGEKKILRENGSMVGQAEGLYWQYESFLKKQDAAYYTVVGAAGELYSIRTSLFSPLENHLIIDDFIISMQVCLAGFRMAYEPGAFAVEAPSLSLAEEKKRKIRIAAGAFQSISHLKQCLNFVKYPLLSFQYFSRRILRWVACPILLVLLFISNALLVAGNQGLIFNYFFFGQSVFYILAMAGRLAKFSKWKLGIFNIPFYFVFMNLCLARGFFKYINRQQTVIWEKAMREIAPE